MTDAAASLRPVQTAKLSDSIWSKNSQDDFRHNLVALEKRTNAVPIDVLTAVLKDKMDIAPEDARLPLHIEKQVADDFAYIAAVSEGAQSVAAVCIEQHVSRDEHGATLVLKVAGMDVVEDSVKSMLRQVAEVLQEVSRTTRESKYEGGRASTDVIFQSVVDHHKQKLLGRLRSKKWTKPIYLGRTHKKCLWQDFENLAHRVQHIYPKRSERKVREATTASITALGRIYADFETSLDATGYALQSLVKDSYNFCIQPETRAYATKLESASLTPQIGAALKALRQLEKIGAYWRIAKDLVGAAHIYSVSLARIQIEYVQPYANVPTEITYESWAGKCHVHAEVQLVVEYALRGNTEKDCNDTSTVIEPRTVGTSKYLCFLCYLFLHYHGGFQALSTHGRLYDQWTVPDLAEYTPEVRRKFARVLEQMNTHVKKQIDETQRPIWRPEPMTSRQNLLCCIESGEDVDLSAVEQNLGKFTLE